MSLREKTDLLNRELKYDGIRGTENAVGLQINSTGEGGSEEITCVLSLEGLNKTAHGRQGGERHGRQTREQK